MAAIQRMDAALGQFLDKYQRDVHTNIRVRVVDVDYSIPSVTVQPMVETKFSDGTVDAYPAIFDVPLQMVSANGGKARLTVPIKAGDILGLSFSERNEGDMADMSTHGLFPGWAITSVHSDGNAMQIHPENVELWNDVVHIEMTPEGDFKVQGPVGNFEIKKDGTLNFTNGGATITAVPGGTITMNGAKVTPDGNFITARGINLNDFYDWMVRHGHPYYWTDPGGNAVTSPPNG